MSDGSPEAEQGDEGAGAGDDPRADHGAWTDEGPRTDQGAGAGDGGPSEREEPVVAQVDADLAAVDQALERLDAGSYGICQICGQAIADEDLEAMPTMTRCADHRELPDTGS